MSNPTNQLVCGICGHNEGVGQHGVCLHRACFCECVFPPASSAARAETRWSAEPIIDCTHPHAGDGPCDDCVERARVLPTLRQPLPTPRIDYATKLRAFNERFQKHLWWRKAIAGTPLSNDLATMAVEVLDALARTAPHIESLRVPTADAAVDAPQLSALQSAYNDGVEDAKKAIRAVGTDDWEGAEFKPYFINEIARTCSPYCLAALDAPAPHSPSEGLLDEDGKMDAEITRIQDGIRDHLVSLGVPNSRIDGAGCDSGDPLDFIKAEIDQAFNYFEDERPVVEQWQPIEKADPETLALLYAPPEKLWDDPTNKSIGICVAKPRDWTWATLFMSLDSLLNSLPEPPKEQTP
jgi:hypothetical protein